MKRAIRRHHYSRLKHLRKKRLEYWDWHMPENLEGLYATTACVCSCFMCGNPRRKFKAITRQEYIANLKFLEGCAESNNSRSLSRNRLGKMGW